MDKKKRLSKSLRKHIRAKKARIRKEVLDFSMQKKLIEELYKNLKLSAFFSKEKAKANK
jgi:hypothetical protein